MKKFKFRYESVLKMRMDAEEQLKNKLGLLNGEMAYLENRILKLHEEARAYEIYSEEEMKKGVSGPLLKSFYQGKIFFSKNKKKLELERKNLLNKILQTREALTESVKQRKIMEKLKEKAYQEFIDAINLADTKVIEEIVNYNNSKLNGDSYGGKT